MRVTCTHTRLRSECGVRRSRAWGRFPKWSPSSLSRSSKHFWLPRTLCFIHQPESWCFSYPVHVLLWLNLLLAPSGKRTQREKSTGVGVSHLLGPEKKFSSPRGLGISLCLYVAAQFWAPGCLELITSLVALCILVFFLTPPAPVCCSRPQTAAPHVPSSIYNDVEWQRQGEVCLSPSYQNQNLIAHFILLWENTHKIELTILASLKSIIWGY